MSILRNLVSLVKAGRPYLAVTLALILAVILIALGNSTPTSAQVPSLTGPFNIDNGKVLVFTNQNGAINSPTGSAYSATPVNYSWAGVVCTMTVTAESGSPTIAWSIKQYDAASNSYFTLLTQTNSPSTLATLPATFVLEVAPAVQNSSLPTNMAAIQLAVPRVWQVSATPSGTGLAATGYVGCNFVKD